VPSKTLLKVAKVAHQIRHASRYGLEDQEPNFDFAAMMQRLRAVRAGVYDDAGLAAQITGTVSKIGSPLRRSEALRLSRINDVFHTLSP